MGHIGEADLLDSDRGGVLEQNADDVGGEEPVQSRGPLRRAAVLEREYEEETAEVNPPDAERENHVRRRQDFDVEAVRVVPPVVERGRGDHRKGAPDAHPGPQRAPEAPEPDGRRPVFRRAPEARPEHEPAARQSREHAAQVDGRVRGGPERVATDRAVPGNVPDDADLGTRRRNQCRGDVPGQVRSERRRPRAGGGPPPSSDHLSPEPPATSPLPRHFSKIFLTCWCASSNACLAVIRPVAALANIVGRTKVSNTSLSAGFAGPGCPMLVAHCKAVLIGLSLEGGFEPNGSFAVTCSSHLLPEAIFCATGAPGSATEPVKDGKLYSLLPRTASR